MSARLKTSIIIVGGVIVLAAAACVALSLLNLKSPGQTSLADGSAKKAGVTANIIPATEVPATDPDVVGILQTLQNTSLTIEPDGQAPAAPVEVVVTTQTRLYRDASQDGAPPTGTTIQMVVAPYSLDQITVGDRIVAWGDRRGDRVVADVILVRVRHPAATPTP